MSYLLNDKHLRVCWLVWFLLALGALQRVLALLARVKQPGEPTITRRSASEELFCQLSGKCFLIVSLYQISLNTLYGVSVCPRRDPLQPTLGSSSSCGGGRVSGLRPADAAVVRNVSLSFSVYIFPNNLAPLHLFSPALPGRPVCMQERPLCPPSMDLRPGGRLRRRVWWNIMQWVTGGRFSSHLFNAALQAAAICAAARCWVFFLSFFVAMM